MPWSFAARHCIAARRFAVAGCDPPRVMQVRPGTTRGLRAGCRRQSEESGALKELPADDDALHVRGAFVDLRDSDVSVDLLDGKLA